MIAIVVLISIRELLKAQSGCSGSELIRKGQLERRYAFSFLVGLLVVCMSYGPSAGRFFLGNRIVKFMSSISFRFYIYHQYLAVKLRQWNVIPASSETPWLNDSDWRSSLFFLSFLLSFVLAVLITYLFEKPVTRVLKRKFLNKEATSQ